VRSPISHTLLLLCSALSSQANLTPPDSGSTAIQFYGGLGQCALVSRGCEGNILSQRAIKFQELAACTEHQFPSPLRLGLCGGYIFDQKEEYTSERYYDPTRNSYFAQSNWPHMKY